MGRVVAGVLFPWVLLSAALLLSDPDDKRKERPVDVVDHTLRSPTVALAQRKANSTGTYQPIERRKSIGLRAYVVQPPPLDFNGDALGYVSDRLAAAMAGDGLASYEIHLRADACIRAASAADQDVFDAYAKAGMGRQYLDGQEKELAHCAPLLGERALLEENWLERAAQQGFVEARLLYAQNPNAALRTPDGSPPAADQAAQYRDTAMAYLEESLDSGSLDALEALGNVHERGILAPKNDQYAYAHKSALQQADAMPWRETELRKLRERLRPDQVAAAEDLAKTLVTRCCAL